MAIAILPDQRVHFSAIITPGQRPECKYCAEYYECQCQKQPTNPLQLVISANPRPFTLNEILALPRIEPYLEQGRLHYKCNYHKEERGKILPFDCLFSSLEELIKPASLPEQLLLDYDSN